MKTRNLVAKHLRTYNKSTVQIDRKKQSKTKPKNKHRNDHEQNQTIRT